MAAIEHLLNLKNIFSTAVVRYFEENLCLFFHNKSQSLSIHSLKNLFLNFSLTYQKVFITLLKSFHECT